MAYIPTSSYAYSQPQTKGYMDRNPDVYDAWRSGAEGYENKTQQEAADWHYNTFGRQEGRDPWQTTPQKPIDDINAAMQNALTSNMGTIKNVYRQGLGYYKPYTTGGHESINTLIGLMRSGPGEFQADPGYNFRLSEAMKAVERSAAAKNALSSGATMKAMNDYAQNIASDEYQRFIDRYYQSLNPWQQTANMGLSAAVGSANLGQAYSAERSAYARALAVAEAKAAELAEQRRTRELQERIYERNWGGFQ